MNQFQIMHFVDRATPQQLKSMVEARNPYSYMALAKLQELRDQELKKKAGSPQPEPLAEAIPQQLAQLERPAQTAMKQLQQPQGIASLPQAAMAAPQAPMMQQAPQQEMPQEMPQEPMQAYGGGLVSFKRGGDVKHYDGEDGSYVTSSGLPTDLVDRIGSVESGNTHINPTTGELITNARTGARGQYQLLPKYFPTGGTRKDVGYGVLPPQDDSAKEHRRAASEYLKAMYSKFKDPAAAVAAYNAGPGTISKALDKAQKAGTDWLNFVPKETQQYVSKVMGSPSRSIRSADAGPFAPIMVAGMNPRITGTMTDAPIYSADADLVDNSSGDSAPETILAGPEMAGSIPNKTRTDQRGDWGARLRERILNPISPEERARFSTVPAAPASTPTVPVRERFAPYDVEARDATIQGPDASGPIPVTSTPAIVPPAPAVPPPPSAEELANERDRSAINNLLNAQAAAAGKVPAAQAAYLKQMEDLIRGNQFNRQAYEAAKGNIAQDRRNFMAEFEQMFPDPNKDLRDSFAEMKKAHAKEGEKLPYEALLKFATGLMSTRSSNLLQAVGDAGGPALAELQKLKEMQRQKQMQLLEADSRLANAQDARKRGMFDMASREAQNAQNSRMEAFKLEQDSKSATAGLLANVAAVKAGMPLQEAQMYGTQIQSAVAVHQAFKENPPEAVKLWKFAQSNPQFMQYMKTQEEVKAASDAFLRINSEYDAYKKSQQLEDPSKILSLEEYTKERMAAWAKARTIRPGPSQ